MCSEGNRSPWRAHTGVGEKCEEEGELERNYYRPTTAPTALLRAGRGRKLRNEWVKLSLRKGGGGGKVLF